MPADASCAEIRELTSELALGIADGQDRARVLEHVAVCAECRRELDELSSLADELLVLAPEHEPPVGFELRTLRRALPKPSRRRWRQPAVALVAASLAASVAAGGVLFAVRGDRRLASEYRATLSQAHGSSFRAVPLQNAAGGRAGTVFVYRGSPSWIFLTISAHGTSSAARAELVTRGNRTLTLPAFRLSSGSWGGAIPMDAGAVAAIHLLDRNGRSVLVAYLPARW